MTVGSPAQLRVIGLPATGHAYQACFYQALRARGVDVVPGMFAGRWLFANVRRGDVVHLHWPSFFYAAKSPTRTALNLVKYIAFLLALRLRGARLAWTAHNLYPHEATRLPGADAIARFATTRLADRVFAHGAEAVEAVADEFRLAREKIVAIPHGHWVNYHYPNSIDGAAARQQLGIPGEARVLLLFGGLERYKNVPLLLRAFEQARQPNEQLWIVGRCRQDELRQEIHAVAAAIPGVHVVDRYVPNDEVQIYLRAADAAVLPYGDGLTSAVAMLALSFGVPVIAPRVGCFSSIVDADCGWLYGPADSRSVDTVAAALRDARQRPFDAQVIRTHAQNFRWQDAAEIFVQAMQPGRNARP